MEMFDGHITIASYLVMEIFDSTKYLPFISYQENYADKTQLI